jgi:aspartyl-tRNA(Asn)/glutamyl-tRNA(Gln) amidotransferase subunit A
LDPDSLPRPNLSFLERVNKLPGGLRIAFSPDLGYARVQKDVSSTVKEAVKIFADMGHAIDVWQGKIPPTDDAWSKLMIYELYALIHNQLEDIRDEMGRTLVKFLDQAKELDVNSLLEIQAARANLNKYLGEIFNKFDLLLSPTMPTDAYAAKGPPPDEIDGHPISLLDAVAFTYPFNLSGHPAATVRAGWSVDGLPVGLQIIGPKYRDDLVLQAAYAYEQIQPWNGEWPDI